MFTLDYLVASVMAMAAGLSYTVEIKINHYGRNVHEVHVPIFKKASVIHTKNGSVTYIETRTEGALTGTYANPQLEDVQSILWRIV